MIEEYPVIAGLGDLPFQPGSIGGEMKCPSCGERTADAWKRLGQQVGSRELFEARKDAAISAVVSLDFMYCANEECRQLVVRIHENLRLPGAAASEMETRTSFAFPRTTNRSIEPEVPESFREDYKEAAAILALSPRMSAVLSRKIVHDLLREYAQIQKDGLKAAIDAFLGDADHPQRIKEYLQHLREIGNFGAHTQKDQAGQVIDVSQDDAEWTLDLIDRLFDYFIVRPKRDEQLAAKWDANAAAAGRKPIR